MIKRIQILTFLLIGFSLVLFTQHSSGTSPDQAADADGDGVADYLDVYPNDATKGFGLWREQFNAIQGTTVADLTGSAKFPGSPDSVKRLTNFKAPDNLGENYGSRLHGVLIAPETGNYTFWIAADDQAALFLSSDHQPGNAVEIAKVTEYTKPVEFGKRAEQKSAPVKLVAGQAYYIKALHKQSTGTDGLAVAWQTPSNAALTIIPASVFMGAVNTPLVDVNGWVGFPAQSDPMMTLTNIPANAATAGMWSPVYDWPLNSIHSMMLPDGRVLTYGSDPTGGPDGRHYDYWNPYHGFEAKTHKTLFNPGSMNSFCSTSTFLSSGTLMLTSGFDPKDSVYIDWQNQNDTLVNAPAKLADERWYATLVTLPDSRHVILGGMVPLTEPMYLNPDQAIAQGQPSMSPEIYENGQWRTLFGAYSREAFGPDFLRVSYPKAFVAPNGLVFGISADKMWYLDIDGLNGMGQITSVYPYKTGFGRLADPVNVGTLATGVMYDIGKILMAGGNGGCVDDGFPGSNMATSIDINGGQPVLTELPRMQHRRRYANGNVLATGEVVITGGSRIANQNGGDAVHTAEIWSPKTNQWTQGAEAAVYRGYHSTAILLQNGAILSSGGGTPGPVTNLNAEIYYPPNLFSQSGGRSVLAQRPIIKGVHGLKHTHKASFEFDMASSETLSSVVLLGLPSTTHANNPTQRRIPLTFTQSGKRISAITPNANLTPPGYYQLVAVNQANVPSYSVTLAIGTQMAPPAIPVLTYDPATGETSAKGVDTDGDGVPDVDDAFPNDASESKDSDGDGIGDGVDTTPEPISIQITQPASAKTLTQGDPYLITATLGNNANPVSRVELYNHGALIATLTKAPYSISGSTIDVPLGEYWIKAKAFDTQGKVAASSGSVIINVVKNVSNQAPTVYIEQPQSDITLTQGDPYLISAVASDSDGSISKVELYNYGTLISTLQNPPYRLQGNTAQVPAGVYSITAKAYDNQGAVTTSKAVNITVKAP